MYVWASRFRSDIRLQANVQISFLGIFGRLIINIIAESKNILAFLFHSLLKTRRSSVKYTSSCKRIEIVDIFVRTFHKLRIYFSFSDENSKNFHCSIR